MWRKRSSRMRIRIIRPPHQPPTRANTGAIEPRLNIAARPDAAPGARGVVLGVAISATGVSRPVQR